MLPALIMQVFVHGSVVEQCGISTGDQLRVLDKKVKEEAHVQPRLQDIVAFDIHVSKDGNPQACTYEFVHPITP